MSIRAANLEDPAEREAIERFLASRAEAQPFHRPAWSRAVETGCDARAHYLVAGEGRSLTGLLPLSEVRSRLFGNSLVSAGFAVGGGIVAGEVGVAQELGDAAWDLARRLGCSEVELRGGPVPRGGAWQLREGVYADFGMDLAEGDEANLLSIKKRQRAEVRRALGFDLQFRAGRGQEDLGAHHLCYSTLVRNHGTPIFPKTLFSSMLEAFGEDADIVSAWKDGRPLSSIFTFYFKGVAYPYWGGGTGEARRWRANEWLYYRLMCHAAARGCERIDFGRSKVGTGAYDFKCNWGMEPRPLAYAVRTAEGAKPREINPLNPKYRLRIALWRKLPLAIANAIGPPIARGLG